ncbi:hypothetical protein [Tenacibaculum xiamenense]|uniref:hypothetical protein n=1 Tax=Tenacibaculum xiamenense TaxID=1261553 RepID=UPI0038B52718
MKKLELNQMENLQGGSWGDWITGACGAVALANLYSAGAFSANPVGAGASAFCVGWTIAVGIGNSLD